MKQGEYQGAALELPPYRAPQVGQVLVRSILDRTLFVLARAVVVAAPAGLPDRKAGGPAGEMKQGEYQGAEGRGGSPPMGCQKTVEFRQAAVVRQGAGGEVSHQDTGHHDLVR